MFAKRVLDLMVRRKRLSQRLRDEMLDWEHSGFSVDGSVKVAVGDYGRLKRLVRYLARPAVSAERVEYDKTGGTATVRSSKKVQGLRPVVARYDALTFLSLLALQVPPPGVHLVRYYGHYSVRSRAGEGPVAVQREPPPPVSTVVPRAHGPPGWLAERQQEGRAVLSREEQDFSQAPAEWDEWEPA